MNQPRVYMCTPSWASLPPPSPSHSSGSSQCTSPEHPVSCIEPGWRSISHMQGDFQLVHPKGDQSWVFIGRNDAKAETPILWSPDAKSWLIWKDPDAGKAGGEGDDRGLDGWMASPTQWTWVWVNSRSWWRSGRPSLLWFMGPQRVGHNWLTELNWTK